MHFDIVAERFKRIDRVTLIAALAILFITYYVVVRVVPFLIYFLDMLGIGNEDIYRYIVITRDYIVIPFILGYYLVSIIFGYWDLKWMNILRHRENPNKYKELSSSIIDNLEDMSIYTKDKVQILNISEIENLEAKDIKEAFIKIGDIFLVLKDIQILKDTELEKGKIIIYKREYEYIGKRLLYNKNIVITTFEVRIGNNE